MWIPGKHNIIVTSVSCHRPDSTVLVVKVEVFGFSDVDEELIPTQTLFWDESLGDFGRTCSTKIVKSSHEVDWRMP